MKADTIFEKEISGDEEVLLKNLKEAMETLSPTTCAIVLKLSAAVPKARLVRAHMKTQRIVDNFIATRHSECYFMHTYDIVLVCHNVELEAIDRVIIDIGTAIAPEQFSGKSITSSAFSKFAVWFDYADLALLSKLTEYVQNLHISVQKLLIQQEEKRGKKARKHATYDMLVDLDHTVREKDLREFINSQAVYKISTKILGNVLLWEYSFDVTALQKAYMQDVDIYDEPWFLNYIYQLLDIQMLRVLSIQNPSHAQQTISFNLSISTVLSKDFMMFHHSKSIPPKNVHIKIQMNDALNNIQEYIRACDLLSHFGYNIILDGVSPWAISTINIANLRADMLKVDGNIYEANARDRELVSQMIKQLGSKNVILCQVDVPEMLQWGMSQHVLQFQGFLMDKIASKYEAHQQQHPERIRTGASTPANPSPSHGRSALRTPTNT